MYKCHASLLEGIYLLISTVQFGIHVQNFCSILKFLFLSKTGQYLKYRFKLLPGLRTDIVTPANNDWFLKRLRIFLQ